MPSAPHNRVPLRNCSVEQARDHILAAATPLATEEIAIDRAIGRHLAREMVARHNLPGTDVSIMDGYALRAIDVQTSKSEFVVFHVAGESAAGHPFHGPPLGAGQACRISTGAAVPASADAVVAQEDCTRAGTQVTVDRTATGPLSAGTFIRPAGSDIRAGDTLLSVHSLLGPGELALLTAGGHVRVPVFRQPRVAIVCSGDELIAPGHTPKPGQVISTNAAMLAHQVREAGGIPVDFGVAADDLAELRENLRRACCCDLILTSGGISVGDHDLVLTCLRDLGMALEVRKVRLRPGRPTTYGRIGDVHVLALPGNPASTYVAFELFARPLILHMHGSCAPQRPHCHVTLDTPIPAAGNRAHYMRASVRNGRATPLGTQVSGALRSLAGHNALLIQQPHAKASAVGDTIEAMLLAPPIARADDW